MEYVKLINFENKAYYYYAYNYKSIRLSTTVKFNKNDIDRNNKIKKTFLNKHPEIISKLNFINNFITEFIIKNKVKPSTTLVKEYLLKNENEIKQQNNYVLDYFKSLYQEKKDFFITYNKSLSSLKDYKSVMNSIIDYQKHINKTLTINDLLNKDNIDAFFNFLQIKHISNNKIKYITKGGLNQNTLRKRLIVLKTFYKFLYENKVIKEIPLFVSKLRFEKSEVVKVFLNPKEIKQLYDFKCDNDKLNKIKDTFVFACLTGMRFSDFTKLKKEYFSYNNGTYFVRKKSEKVSKYFQVPLTSTAIKIAKELDYNFYFDNQYFNKNLKKVCKKIGIFEQSIFKNDKYYKKYELITAHTARHSFVTNLISANCPLNYVMGMTGHQKLDTLNIYIQNKQPTDNKILTQIFE